MRKESLELINYIQRTFWSLQLKEGDFLNCDECNDVVVGHKEVHVFVDEAVRQDRCIGKVLCTNSFMKHVANCVSVGALSGTYLSIRTLEKLWRGTLDFLGFFELPQVIDEFARRVETELLLEWKKITELKEIAKEIKRSKGWFASGYCEVCGGYNDNVNLVQASGGVVHFYDLISPTWVCGKCWEKYRKRRGFV